MGKPQGDGSNQSALKRMRASLQTAGVLAGSQPRKGSKKYQKRLAKLARENPEQLVRNAKERHEKLDAISTLYNPFDIKTNKPLKVKAVGRKVKGVRGAPTLSKQVGLENRKKTLLVEWQNRHRSGGLIDRRFGENNPHLTPEEKMMERFARERE
ncbi:nucleolar complex protein 14, partial [Dimargaris verticillata]